MKSAMIIGFFLALALVLGWRASVASNAANLECKERQGTLVLAHEGFICVPTYILININTN